MKKVALFFVFSLVLFVSSSLNVRATDPPKDPQHGHEITIPAKK